MDSTPQTTRLLIELTVVGLVALSVVGSLVAAALLMRNDRAHWGSDH